MTHVYSAAHPELGLDKAQSGIECCICRQGGHFCPAVVWASGNPNVGICCACRDGYDCPKFAKLRKGLEPMPVLGVDVDVAMNFLSKTFPTSAGYFADTLSDSEVIDLKKVADLAPAVCWFIEIKVLGRWQMAIFDPVFYEDQELARANARKLSDETASREARTIIWRKDALGPGIVPARRGRPPGSQSKPPAPKLTNGTEGHKEPVHQLIKHADTPAVSAASISDVFEEVRVIAQKELAELEVNIPRMQERVGHLKTLLGALAKMRAK